MVILGVQPSEYEELTPGAARELFKRLEKHREAENKGDSERRNAEFDALMKTVGNVVKALNNTNELLSKRPTI
jgi:hypothetical protein